MPIKELAADIWDEYRTRARYRIVSSYILCFMTYHWYDLSVMAFDDSPFRLKAEAFRSELYADKMSWGIILLMALGWMYGVPLLNYWLETGRNWLLAYREVKIRFASSAISEERYKLKNKGLQDQIISLQSKLNGTRESLDSIREGYSGEREQIYLRINLYAKNRARLTEAIYKIVCEGLGAHLVKVDASNQEDETAVIADILNHLENLPSTYLEDDVVGQLNEVKEIRKEFEEKWNDYAQACDYSKMTEIRNRATQAVAQIKNLLEEFRPSINDNQLRIERVAY